MSDTNQRPGLEDCSEDPSAISRKSVRKWVNSSIDRYLVKSIKNSNVFNFKFLDNTSLNGKVKWFNKYNLGVIVEDGTEYVLLKHALKYMKSLSNPNPLPSQ